MLEIDAIYHWIQHNNTQHTTHIISNQSSNHCTTLTLLLSILYFVYILNVSVTTLRRLLRYESVTTVCVGYYGMRRLLRCVGYYVAVGRRTAPGKELTPTIKDQRCGLVKPTELSMGRSTDIKYVCVLQFIQKWNIMLLSNDV